MPNVNPEILRWARETAGLTLEDAVQKLKISKARGVPALDRLAALEAGEEAPTRPMLVKMAKQYRRPLLTFYMSAPPRKADRGQDFGRFRRDTRRLKTHCWTGRLSVTSGLAKVWFVRCWRTKTRPKCCRSSDP